MARLCRDECAAVGSATVFLRLGHGGRCRTFGALR
jgi:hypothetical protein